MDPVHQTPRAISRVTLRGEGGNPYLKVHPGFRISFHRDGTVSMNNRAGERILFESMTVESTAAAMNFLFYLQGHSADKNSTRNIALLLGAFAGLGVVLCESAEGETTYEFTQ